MGKMAITWVYVIITGVCGLVGDRTGDKDKSITYF